MSGNDDLTTIRSSKAKPRSPSENLPASARVILLFLNGPRAGEEFELNQTDLVVGRGSQSDLMIDDFDVSRMHFRVLYHKPDFLLRDLMSMNGTVLNGESIREGKLRHGDTIAIGHTRLQFLIEEIEPTGTYRLDW